MTHEPKKTDEDKAKLIDQEYVTAYDIEFMEAMYKLFPQLEDRNIIHLSLNVSVGEYINLEITEYVDKQDFNVGKITQSYKLIPQGEAVRSLSIDGELENFDEEEGEADDGEDNDGGTAKG